MADAQSLGTPLFASVVTRKDFLATHDRREVSAEMRTLTDNMPHLKGVVALEKILRESNILKDADTLKNRFPKLEAILKEYSADLMAYADERKLGTWAMVPPSTPIREEVSTIVNRDMCAGAQQGNASRELWRKAIAAYKQAVEYNLFGEKGLT